MTPTPFQIISPKNGSSELELGSSVATMATGYATMPEIIYGKCKSQRSLYAPSATSLMLCDSVADASKKAGATIKTMKMAHATRYNFIKHPFIDK